MELHHHLMGKVRRYGKVFGRSEHPQKSSILCGELRRIPYHQNRIQRAEKSPQTRLVLYVKTSKNRSCMRYGCAIKQRLYGNLFQASHVFTRQDIGLSLISQRLYSTRDQPSQLRYSQPSLGAFGSDETKSKCNNLHGPYMRLARGQRIWWWNFLTYTNSPLDQSCKAIGCNGQSFRGFL